MIPVAEGTLRESGIDWKLETSERVTPDDIRAIASQLHAVATRMENDPPSPPVRTSGDA